jgi:hypothetical protein
MKAVTYPRMHHAVTCHANEEAADAVDDPNQEKSGDVHAVRGSTMFSNRYFSQQLRPGVGHCGARAKMPPGRGRPTRK